MADNTKKEITLYAMFQSPGPSYRLKSGIGINDHCPTLKQGPAFSMGHRPSEKVESKPGPIYWYDPKLTTQGKIHIPTCFISGRPKDKAPSDTTPGPGDYDLMNIKNGVLSKDQKPPKISIRGRIKYPNPSDAPPPNRYDICTGLGSRAQTVPIAPAWTLQGRSDFGTAHYGPLKEATPGPANYFILPPGASKTRSKGFTIQGRTSLKDYETVKDNPGPNAYDPQSSYQMVRRKKGFTMGIKHSKYIMPLIDTSTI